MADLFSGKPNIEAKLGFYSVEITYSNIIIIINIKNTVFSKWALYWKPLTSVCN